MLRETYSVIFHDVRGSKKLRLREGDAQPVLG
jgi:hypothetical protein